MGHQAQCKVCGLLRFSRVHQVQQMNKFHAFEPVEEKHLPNEEAKVDISEIQHIMFD